MSAAAERAALARIGANLIAMAGERGDRRARSVGGDRRPVPPATGFADIAAAPVWLQSPREELTRLALRAALIAMAPALAASIDGGWLRELAALTGEGALDHAIALAPSIPDGGIAAVPVDATKALGFDVLRAALPPALHRYLDWAPGGEAPCPPAVAAVSIRNALAVLPDEPA
ncbi:hypothetical protein ASG29_02490 [Sphingomonas sp. Leaf412]|uniref:hypothetical protein n=1 Tax=Sphingomonas sp. Leaf412 TaxID=1736370 RepID=UPI0006FBF656|nr:hypothetical protein [Sphingomonas sp. Leaf412]KQT35020.1 hypothetical protein ASG29_02490 [Sphingomonas sp. Leaf412]